MLVLESPQSTDSAFSFCIPLAVDRHHGLRTPREEIAFTARPKIQSQSQIFRHLEIEQVFPKKDENLFVQGGIVPGSPA